MYSHEGAMSGEQDDGTGAGRSMIPVGVSSCLLGQEVRYDASHKRNPFITEALSRYFRYIPVCPEVAIGLPTPRPPIRLEQAEEDQLRLRGVHKRELDVTASMRAYGQHKARELSWLSGYILKSKSPSCGMERVKVYKPDGHPAGFSDRGLYAKALMEHNTLMPVEEEGRLNDPALREGFVCRVFCYYRWQRLIRVGLTRKALVDFHAEHKLLLMAHDEQRMRALGRLVSDLGEGALASVAERYIHAFMTALAQPATRGRHANVLYHLLGYLKQELEPADRREAVAVIEQYRTGMVPLIVPLTLLRHHFRHWPDPYVQRQFYLYWSPPDLALLNRV
ncbi:MAG: YbgA family protein [Halorhodospira sp.]